jgi:hypothetical protein
MKSSTSKAPTPIEAATAVFGENPADVLFALESATRSLNWLEAIFDAIGALYNRDHPTDALNISLLAEAGAFIAERASSNAHDSHAQWCINLDAAKAKEGGAA